MVCYIQNCAVMNHIIKRSLLRVKEPMQKKRGTIQKTLFADHLKGYCKTGLHLCSHNAGFLIMQLVLTNSFQVECVTEPIAMPTGAAGRQAV